MNKRVKLFGWRIFAVICLSFMTPMAVLMGDWGKLEADMAKGFDR